MRIFILFFIVTTISISGKAQTWTSSCSYTPAQEAIYRGDAIRLASCRLQQINHPWKDSAKIYQPVYDSLLKVLVAMRNMQWTSLKDTITNMFGFADFGSSYYEADSTHVLRVSVGTNFYGSFSLASSAKTIEVWANPSISWVADWANNNFNNTANQTVNYLVNTYGLVITKSPYIIGGKYYFTVRANNAINASGLAAQFNNLAPDDDLTANTKNFGGDGNSINAIFENDGIKLTFYNGCGDCPAGCTYGSSWTFKVFFESCSVQFLSSVHNEFFTFPPQPFPTSTCTRGAVMPMEFSSIKAYHQNEVNKVEWGVSTETNINRYEIEKSSNGILFEVIDIVTAKNINGSSYSSTDNKPVKGNNFYRIKVVNKSGIFKYSNIILVKTDGIKNGISIYPNPVIGKTINIQLNGISAGNYEMNMFSLAGQKVFTKSFNLVANNFFTQISLPEKISAGSYLISINGNKASFREVITVQ